MRVIRTAELEIMRYGLSSPERLDDFCGYFFNKGDGNFFKFDRNFTPEGAWQKKLIFARQNLIVGVMGIGSGKTLGVGMAAATWGMSTGDFKFLNGANWAYQAKLMKELIEAQLVDTPAESFVENSVDTPYPKITLGMTVGRSRFRSTMEFMSMDKQAAKIFSWRGDWINLDEAALIQDLDIALMNLSTRLTGRTARGREYLGRMSLMTNPWDNEASTHIYYFYDMAVDNPEECLSISIPTSANKNVTDNQLKGAMRFIRDPEEQERLLEGRRPEGKGKYFAKPRVDACADTILSDYLIAKYEKGEPGYQYVTAPTLGAVEFQLPRSSDQLILVGDPGTGAYPARNAPCLGVIDASRLPDAPAVLIAFWWGDGGRHINPFIDKLYEYREKYRPMFIGVDSTGPQAGMVQVLNLQDMWADSALFQMRKPTFGQVKVPITGMDFSVGRKMQMLVSLRNIIELGLLRWPDFAKGIRAQLYHYDPLLDRGGEPKIAQDIVAMLSMGAFVAAAYYGMELADANEAIAHRRRHLETIRRNLRLPDDRRNWRRADPEDTEFEED